MNEHPNLAAALVAACAELTVVETTRTAKIPTKNGGEYSYKFADIADVVKMSRPVLANHGVVALTPVHGHDDGLACTVIFLHSSGDRMDCEPFPFPKGENAQATGSMVTYHRRYALVAALGIAAGDEDDGQSAAPAQRSQEPTQVQPNPKAEPLIDRLALLPEEAQGKILSWFGTPVAEWSALADEHLDRLAEQITKAESKLAVAP